MSRVVVAAHVPHSPDRAIKCRFETHRVFGLLAQLTPQSCRERRRGLQRVCHTLETLGESFRVNRISHRPDGKKEGCNAVNPAITGVISGAERDITSLISATACAAIVACMSRISDRSCSFFAPSGFFAVARAMTDSFTVSGASNGFHSSPFGPLVGILPTDAAAASINRPSSGPGRQHHDAGVRRGPRRFPRPCEGRT